MYLIETYPEIDLFFKKSQFTEGDLNLLIQELTAKYNSTELTKVKGIFELKLLEYTLKTHDSQHVDNKNVVLENHKIANKQYDEKDFIEIEKRKRLEQKKKAIREYKKNFNIKVYTNNGIESKSNSKTNFDNNETQPQSEKIIHLHLISDIALKLDWSVHKIQSLIQQRTGIKNAITITNSEYKLCNDIFEARKEAIKRQRKNEAYLYSNGVTRKHKTTSKKSSGVWDRIAKFGPGKIIYIRSR